MADLLAGLVLIMAVSLALLILAGVASHFLEKDKSSKARTIRRVRDYSSHVFFFTLILWAILAFVETLT